MKKLIHEVHRRSLWQVLGIYLAGSWVALQVVETMSESMTLPDWVQPLAFILLIVGLPVVLATAFVQEGVGRGGRSRGPDSADSPSVEDAFEPRPAGGSAAPTRLPSGPWALLTWRRALLGGVGSAAILLLALLGWMTLRSLGIGPAGTLVAKGLLEERATILLTDFSADDPSLSRAATEAFRVDLDQSRVIDLAEPGFVKAVLERMERDPELPLDLETGRELAVREGLPAVIGGQITRAGNGYVLTARVVTPGDGGVLVSDRETADGDDGIVPAIDRLSKKLRERIGESLGDLAGGMALERVTTGDLEGLRLYSEAVEASDRGQNQRSADLLEEAVARDTGFAMAWRKLGVVHVSGGGALGNYTRGVEALGRAYALRDRLTLHERELATAGYFTYVARDARKAADAYERMLERDPEDTWALNNLAIIVGPEFGDAERAEDLLLRAVALDTLSRTHHWNLTAAQADLGEYDDARRTLRAWRRRLPGDPLAVQFRAALDAASRDFEAADSAAIEAMTVRPGNRVDEALSYGLLRSTAAARGKLAEADGRSGEDEAAAAEIGAGRALRAALGAAWRSLEVRGDPAAASSEVDAALSAYPLESMGPLDPPWRQLVELAARTGSAQEGRDMLTRWEAADPNASGTPGHARGAAWIAIAAGDADEALRQLRTVGTRRCPDCPLVSAEAWARADQADSTIAELQRWVERHDLFRILGDASRLGPTLERLGRLYDDKGDPENAVLYYAQFVELWAEADEELQPRVRAAQARLEEILRERG